MILAVSVSSLPNRLVCKWLARLSAFCLIATVPKSCGQNSCITSVPCCRILGVLLILRTWLTPPKIVTLPQMPSGGLKFRFSLAKGTSSKYSQALICVSSVCSMWKLFIVLSNKKPPIRWAVCFVNHFFGNKKAKHFIENDWLYLLVSLQYTPTRQGIISLGGGSKVAGTTKLLYTH